jgi:hypothetical protein
VVLIVVNSTIYGGAGGSVGTYSLAAGATESPYTSWDTQPSAWLMRTTTTPAELKPVKTTTHR